MERSNFDTIKPDFTPLRDLKIGEVVKIDDSEYHINEVVEGADLAEKFGYKLNRRVPVYFLDGSSDRAQGGYHPEADIILIFKNMVDQSTIEHEVIHAIEYHIEPTPGLSALYEKAKEIITEDSFKGGFVSNNFRESIHEFIADGKTKIKTVLENVGLADEFTKETAYIFE